MDNVAILESSGIDPDLSAPLNHHARNDFSCTAHTAVYAVRKKHRGRVTGGAGEMAGDTGSISRSRACAQGMAAQDARRMLELFQSVGAERFVLTWRTMNEQIARVRKHWSTPYIPRMLPDLLTEAERDRLNLFIRPHSTRTSLIQLDDLSQACAQQLIPVAFLTLQTSPAKAQAWIAIPAGRDADEDRDFRRRVKKAVRSDPMASGSVRIAGSLNFKPRYAPDFPRVAITHGASGLLASREALEAQSLFAAPEPPPAVLLAPEGRFRGRKAWPDYQVTLAGAPPNQDKSGPDRSLADFTWCLTALSWGWGLAKVSARLRQVSEKAAGQGHVRQRGGNTGVAEAAMDHAATVAIWVGTWSSGGIRSAIGSVCM